MCATYNWCQDKTKLAIFGKQVMFVNIFGTKLWYLNGRCHRENGPAIEYANGNKWWFLNDILHREDGPAIEFANGDRLWYLSGQPHTEDGHVISHAVIMQY